MELAKTTLNPPQHPGNLTDERDAHLADQLLEKARNISGGMLRRLGLAATLVHDPQLQ